MGIREKKHITKEEVQHTAWLAHIKLSEDELVQFTKQLNRILDYFKNLDKAETERVPPTYHVADLINIWRDDKTREGLQKEEVIGNAPRKEKGFFRSPRMV